MFGRMLAMMAAVAALAVFGAAAAEAGGRGRVQVFAVQAANGHDHCNRGGGNQVFFVQANRARSLSDLRQQTVIQTRDRSIGPFGIFGRSRTQTIIRD